MYSPWTTEINAWPSPESAEVKNITVTTTPVFVKADSMKLKSVFVLREDFQAEMMLPQQIEANKKLPTYYILTNPYLETRAEEMILPPI